MWNTPEDKTFTIPRHRAGGKHLASALLAQGVDVACAYRPPHHPLDHAFPNSVPYIDYDRTGFLYPVVPFAVNAHGRWLTAGNRRAVSLPPTEVGSDAAELDPPAPQPWRCLELGEAVARARAATPGALPRRRLLELGPFVPRG